MHAILVYIIHLDDEKTKIGNVMMLHIKICNYKKNGVKKNV